eukprot:1822086-Pyramimonas_sp.AAC.1
MNSPAANQGRRLSFPQWPSNLAPQTVGASKNSYRSVSADKLRKEVRNEYVKLGRKGSAGFHGAKNPHQALQRA